MNKSAIKNFAVTARIKLKEQIKQKAFTFGITKGETKPVEVFEDTFEVNGNKYNKRLLKHRESLGNKIKEDGFDQVIEEITYTWFNRFIAIRFMEVNEYLPAGVRVLSSIDNNKVEPDIIREAANLDFENLNLDLIYKLQDENNTEELFKYLLIKQCNELGKIIPVVFEEIEDYTELLCPDNLLQEGSVIRDLVILIDEEDWKDQVEIIGWLYQYYISEKKDEVFADLKKSIKISKENIPAATQLFTPDWIVKYMVENSLGRLWLESHPNEELKSMWKYHLEEAEQEQEVQIQLEEIREKNKDLKPENIKFLDPCMGSGHILVYAFDVLYDIYKTAGYAEREIPKLILTKNLYGLEIDDRAAQLAYFSVMMKARSYSRRIFKEKIDLNICSIQESNEFPKEAIDFLVNPKETEIEKRIRREDVEYLINVFNDAKEYGSILDVKEIDFGAIERRIEEIRYGKTTDIFEWQYRNIILEKVPGLINQAKIMSQQYDVVCTNPPYMGNGNMNIKLLEYLKKQFPNSKNDLYSVFIEKCVSYNNNCGFTAMITQQSWMFLSSFTELRENVICKNSVYSMLHLGPRAFEEIGGEVVQSTTFVLRNFSNDGYKGSFIRLVEFNIAKDKEINYLEILKSLKSPKKYTVSSKEFYNIPNTPFSYWVSSLVRKIFNDSEKIEKYGKPRRALQTGDAAEFIRNWYEVSIKNIGFNIKSRDEAINSNYKWFLFNNGGTYKKWFANIVNVVDWGNNGFNIKSTGKAIIPSEQYYFNRCIYWNKISTGKMSVKYQDNGIIPGDASPCFFSKNDSNLIYIMSLLNSKVSTIFFEILSPTLNFQSGDVARVPVVYCNETQEECIRKLALNNVEISRSECNCFEISSAFTKHPFLCSYCNNNMIQKSFYDFSRHSEEMFNKMKINEEELNRIFIKIYRLQDELTPDVDDKDITIRKADRAREIKSFISYAVGCMFGRYSLDEEGLIYAGGEFNIDRYKIFKVDIDNVIPITDDEYFEDDIVSRFVGFVKITFSEETLEENLDYIADTLGKKGNETSRQTIRRYFVKYFYKDHLHTYQNRPIYWLFDSGKNDGFKALIYMHRYDIDTVARVRTDYLHLLQRKYDAEVNRLDMVMGNNNATAREKTEARKKKEKIKKQILECAQYDQVIAHVANQKISIDLDDGVKINYEKFQGVEVPQGEGKRPLKADLLAKI